MQLLTRGPVRLVRAVAVAGACTLLPAAGHLGGGGAAAPGALLVAGALLLTACLALSRVRWTARRLAGVALAAQPVVHVAANPPADLHAGLHGLHGGLHGGLDPAMLAGHGLSALALALVLVRGEDLLWRCAAAVAAAVGARPLPRRPAAAPVRGAARVRPTAPAPLRPLPVPRSVPRRGPPLVVRPAS